MAIRAVIFDLDGVLVDSEIWWHEIREAWAEARGRHWTDADSRAVMGANSRAWAHIMASRFGLPAAAEPAIEREIVDAVVDRYRTLGAPLIPGAVEAVRRIAATLPVAVASSAHRRVIEAALAATGLASVIPLAVSSDEVAHGKPQPDVYLETARRLGQPPHACLVVEDSLNGVRAARSAGMAVILVPNASVPAPPEAAALADRVVARLAELDPETISRAPWAVA